MATLDELLTKDGFVRGRDKPKTWPRGGPAWARDKSLSSSRLGCSGSKAPPSRTRSDVNRRKSLFAAPEKTGFKQPVQSNVAGSIVRSVDWYEAQLPKLQDPRDSVNESKEVEGSSGRIHRRASSIEASNVNSKSRMHLESQDGYSSELQMKLIYNSSFNNNLFENEEPNGSEIQNSHEKPSFNGARVGRPVPALDNAGLKEIASMINSCVNQIIKDESFRSSLREACVSSLKSIWVQFRQSKDNGVISVLVEAIKAVERIITEGPNQFDLKKAFLNLNFITGLKSRRSDDDHTCGIPRSYLAACGHLYLSILYKIQKKDNVSAEYLLQVFCDSPYHARTTLLPELWDRLFLPHISHLNAWHEKEASSMSVTSGSMMKLEFLQKVYNDVVDLVTSQFATYYKGWLMGDGNGSALPYICIPFASVPDITEDANEVVSLENFVSSNSIPSKTMISKRLYSVLSQASRNKTTDDMGSMVEEEKDEVGDETEEDQADVWRRKYADAYMKKNDENGSQSSNAGTYAVEHFQEYYEACSQNSAASFEITPENDKIKGNYCCSSTSSILEAEEIKYGSKMVTKRHIHVRKCDPQENENELKLKKLAKAASQLRVADHSDDANTHIPKQTIDSPVCYSERDEMAEVIRTKLVVDETDVTNGLFDSCSLKERPPSEILLGHLENNYQDSLFSRIPGEFICPLTGQLFMEPVTLESGHTFELVAIKDRFNQGNRTCPVTGQTLNCSLIPDTNMVLKHVIHGWVANCFRSSISLASKSTFSPLKQVRNYKFVLSVLIIEQILTGFSLKEGKEIIEHLISLGG
ncbi:Putative E3 ubiquitin-protein ligase LIN-1 [Dendrobium catenatum]|uniref:E3 ubiquitin-protein ligase LIN-1 n=1 Tax=Dendrobium catenatum TaxID=906689 RepID=A0A2I0XCE5_9ASPA|nr:Putative E3 ubiquitin-protein ligase LIN-1 [Dendrobium catenatum]